MGSNPTSSDFFVSKKTKRAIQQFGSRVEIRSEELSDEPALAALAGREESYLFRIFFGKKFEKMRL